MEEHRNLVDGTVKTKSTTMTDDDICRLLQTNGEGAMTGMGSVGDSI